MRLFKSRGKLRSDKKGNVLIMTAAAMPLLIGSAGLAIDTIQLSLMKRHLQRAVDSGALAGAFAKAQDKEGTVIEEAVDDALDYNEAFPLIGEPDITHPTTGTHGGRSVRVEISAVRSLPFMSFFTGSPPTITVDATAALVYTGQYCMVSLDQGSSVPGITFGGSSTVNLGCGVIANGSAAEAVTINGTSTQVTASPVAAVGGVESVTGVYQGDTLLLPYSLPQRDPFRDLPDPSPDCSAAVPLTDQASVDASVATGNRCFTSADISGTVTLPGGGNGDYYITGPLTLNGGSTLVGDGVTLVLTDNPNVAGTSYPTITYAGNANLVLTPPASGPYEGLIMYYDRRAPLLTHTINGNSDSVLEGAFYFPSQHLTFNGNSGLDANCIQMVAHRLTFEGSTTITNVCDSGGGGAQNFDASWVRLVS